jgi:hypothetical protein
VLVAAVTAAAAVTIALAWVWLVRKRGDFAWLAEELNGIRRRRAARAHHDALGPRKPPAAPS